MIHDIPAKNTNGTVRYTYRAHPRSTRDTHETATGPDDDDEAEYPPFGAAKYN